MPRVHFQQIVVANLFFLLVFLLQIMICPALAGREVYRDTVETSTDSQTASMLELSVVPAEKSKEGVTLAPTPTLNIVTSIAPLYALAAGLVDDYRSQLHLLVRNGQSPHTYALRPSDAKAIQNADLIFWIGESFESFLVKPLKNLMNNNNSLEMHQAEGLLLLPYREPGEWSHEADDDDGDNHHHHPGETDMHVWLSPTNAKAIVAAMAEALIVAEPGRSEVYRQREMTIQKQLDQLDLDIKERLRSVQGVPFVVFHDGFHYFEHRYQLQGVTAITPSPQHRPGAGGLSKIRSLLKERRITCLFQEPQFDQNIARSIIESQNIKIGLIDPLGSQIPLDQNHYFAMMDQLADRIAACLSPIPNTP
ncbi:MAG: zinc ABC transporter substrate-binding protein [Magnetococcales bacterium]|nr:zinc ABC transporter substrate-binding protein [Magnetococcales bacterium]